MHSLEAILQLHIATDPAAVTHLPFVLSILTQDTLQSSNCIPKWVARINSLITSKNAGTRWAGLCLAFQTGALNKNILKECSQHWISICLPILSRNEDIPNIKTSIRLLNHIFFLALDIPEYQRQLATPNVPKYSTALLNLAEKTENQELQSLCLESITCLVPVYPTLHRQLQSNISTLCFRLLSGKITGSYPNVIAPACSLLSVSHLTGGKVASTTAWRKTLELSIVNAWSAFSSLRATFPAIELPSLTQTLQPVFEPPPSDPLIAIPLSLDRLKSASYLIICLLKAPVYRPTTVGIGELVKLALTLLKCPSHTEDPPFDMQRRGLEVSVVPQIWDMACSLLSHMAASFKHYLNPSLCWILSSILHSSERASDKSQRIIFLRSLETILSHTCSFHSPVLVNRLVKYLISQLAILLPQKAITPSHMPDTSGTTSKRGKKRARGFDGDEAFRVDTVVLCADHLDEEVVLVSLNVLELLLPNPHISSSLRVLSTRLLISVLFEIPRFPAVLLSRNPSFQGALYSKVLVLCRKQMTSGAIGWLNNEIGLVVSVIDRSGISQGDDKVFRSMDESRRDLDMLLHPRLPPPLRSNPPLTAVTLFQSQGDTDAKADREVVGISPDEDMFSAQPGHKDQQPQLTEAPLTTRAQKEIMQPVNTTVSIPEPVQQVASFPLPGAQQLLDETMETEAIALPHSERQTVDAVGNAQTQEVNMISNSTTEKSDTFTLSQSQKITQQFTQQWQRFEPTDNDDSEKFPEINLESDSD